MTATDTHAIPRPATTVQQRRRLVTAGSRPPFPRADGPQDVRRRGRCGHDHARLRGARRAAASSSTSTATTSSTSDRASRSPPSATAPRGSWRRCRRRSRPSPTPASWSRRTRATWRSPRPSTGSPRAITTSAPSLFNSGAEAVENAVKIARAHTGRQAVVVVRPRLPRPHEPHDGDDGQEHAVQERVRPVRARGLPRAAHLSVPRWRGLTAQRPRPARSTRSRSRSAPRTSPRIVIEPIQGEGGFIVPAPGFLPALVDVVPRERRGLHRRRGADRIRPHRRDVRVRPRGRRARPRSSRPRASPADCRCRR